MLTEQIGQWQIAFNPNHEIFEGHFPGNPIVPGVCMLQICKELLAEVLKKEIVISKIDFIKFMKIIHPQNDEFYTLSLNISSPDFNASISRDENVYFKLKATFGEG